MNKIPWLLYGDMEPLGGAYRYFCDLLHVLDAELRPALIFLPSASLTPEIERVACESGIGLFPVQLRSRWDFSAFQGLRKAVRKHQIRHANLQLSSLFWGNKSILAMLRAAGVRRLALTAHAIDPPKERAVKAALRYAETRFYSSFVTDWIALADYDRKIFRSLGASGNAIAVLRPCVPLISSEAGPDWDALASAHQAVGIRRWIGFVGVLRRAKGIFELLDAFHSIGTEFPDVGLLVVGDGEERAALLEKYGKLNLMSRVLFTGYRSDGRALLRHCVACVLPSHTEHYPYVLLEAMAEGIPIVATRVGAVPEMLNLRYGERGTLVPPKDVGALANAMKRVLTDRTAVQEAVERARRFVQETSTTNHFSQAANAFHRRWLGLEKVTCEDRG